MTAPMRPEANRERWYVRPSTVLPVIAALILLTALFAPDRLAGRTGDPRLSSYSAAPQGARLFYELARRLGWQVEQRRTPEFIAAPDVIHAVLDPRVPLRMGEAHALLEHVRQGGALFLVLGANDLLGDSLHVAPGVGGTLAPPFDAATAACTRRPRAFVPLWPDTRAHLFELAWKGPPPDAITTFLAVEVNGRLAAQRRELGPRPAAVGFPFGRGRIVVGSDPDLLRNDVIRSCEYGLDLAVVRMLEFLRDGGPAPRGRIVFDEFHQGFGSQAGTMSTVASFLGGTRSGRVYLQVVMAGLILLVALAPRTIPPREMERIERRSPLEHVDALARAYRQVGATRTVTTRLVHGVRRRAGRGAIRTNVPQSDDAFLNRALEADPALAPDVGAIRRALASASSREELAAVGAALERLEHSLKRT